ncbi:hypothetical protein MFUR16E_04610 [Methylobacterium fujisawaense]
MTASMSPAVRSMRLAEAQNWRCCYCGFVMLSPAAGRDEALTVLGSGPSKGWRHAFRYRRMTKDHIRPRCESGSDGFENLVAACAFCNEYRGNRPADEAFQRIQRLIRRGTHPHQVWRLHRRFPQLTRLPSLPPASRSPSPDLPPPAAPVREPTGALAAPTS